jgi:hypothetical protein
VSQHNNVLIIMKNAIETSLHQNITYKVYGRKWPRLNIVEKQRFRPPFTIFEQKFVDVDTNDFVNVGKPLQIYDKLTFCASKVNLEKDERICLIGLQWFIKAFLLLIIIFGSISCTMSLLKVVFQVIIFFLKIQTI